MKDKLYGLIVDQRRFKERLAPAMLVSFACCFTFIIFAIYDLYINNRSILPFAFNDIAWPVALIGMVAFIISCGLLLCLRGKLFDTILSFSAGILIAGYVQGNFLNLQLGQLTGDAIDWSQYSVYAVFNLVIWFVIILLPLILRYLNKNIWKKAMIIVPILLVGMQTAGLLSAILTNDLDKPHANLYVSEAGEFELSKENNIIVFVLDRLDGKYIDQVKQSDPTFFDELDGFTYYPNHTSLYCRTYPSVPYIFSGQISLYDKPADEYFADVWENNQLLSELKKHGFTNKFYMSEGYAYTDAAQLANGFDNIAEATPIVHTRQILKKMLNFSAYRYAPHALKASFWFSSDTFDGTVTMAAEEQKYVTDDYRFYNRLIGNKLQLTDTGKGNFAYYHLHGCHTPYFFDENLNLVPSNVEGLVPHTKGEFEILYEYIRQMKELGVYDDATIIIMGDHGESDDFNSPQTYLTTGLFVKPAGSAGVPLQQSEAPVSHENFRATIAKGAGLDPSEFGTPYEDVAQNADITRRFLYRINESDGHPGILEEYTIKGDARNFENWTKVNDYVIEYPHG